MKLKVKSTTNWNLKIQKDKVYTGNLNIDAEYIDIMIDEEPYPSFLFEPYCPICDGKGHDILRIDTTGFNNDLMEFDEDSEYDVPAEPIKIDCHFCEGRKMVSWEEIREMHEKKSKYCSCHHVKESDVKHVTEQKWIHTVCGKIIQE